jgi:UDP-3-O-[3-hydroxymyristoyl] glucosamine N-acyltransferase
VIYLWTNGEGWSTHELSEVNEIAKRGIRIGDGARIGDKIYINDGVSIGNGVFIGDGTIVNYGVNIGAGVYIGKKAIIGNSASISNGAVIGNSAIVHDGANIGYRTRIGDRSCIGYRTIIGDRAYIGYRASVGDDAVIGNGARPLIIYIFGSSWALSYWGQDRIDIGCERHSIAEWIEHGAEIGQRQGASAEQIVEYLRYCNMVAALHSANPDTAKGEARAAEGK